MSSYFTDPAQQFFLELSQNRNKRNQSYYEQMGADPALLSRLIAQSTANPTASAELNLALAQGGIAAGDPLAQYAANAELQQRSTLGSIETPGGGWWDDLTGIVDEWVANPIQGAVRWGFASWDAAYNMLAGGAPIRAHQQQNLEGGTYGEAWREQDPYFFEALGGLFAGERVNLGSGWMPQSDVADPVRQAVNEGMMQVERDTNALPANERYKTRLEASPGVWTKAIADNAQAQAELGKPLTQLHDVNAESIMFGINDIHGNVRYTPWSPGRIAAAHIVEPGTQPFKILSGVGDITSQMFLDPVDWAGLAWAKAGRNSRRVWAEATNLADEVVEASRPAQLALPAGAPTPPIDTSRQVALQMGPQVRGNIPPYTQVGDAVAAAGVPSRPWWLGGQVAERVLGPFDPPKWYVDHVQSVRKGAVDQVAGAKPKRKLAGVYEMDAPRIPGQAQQKIRIQRQGKGRKKYWEVVMPDGSRVSKAAPDPRFSASTTQFRTLDEATQVANEAITGNFDELSKVHGMTVDEFMNSAEEFAVSDPTRLAAQGTTSRSPRQVAHRAKHTKSKKARGKLENVRVMVYGKTIDLTEKVGVDELPQGLQRALRADRGKVRGNDIVGWGDQGIENWDNTMRWMTDNGYGKLKWDDETTLLNDAFIGGDPAAGGLTSRAFFHNADEPMYRYHAPLDDVGAPTPNEVNELVDFVASSGYRNVETQITDPARAGLQGDGFAISSMSPQHPGVPGQRIDVFDERAKSMADRIKSAENGRASDGTLPGVRPDTDPNFTLHGAKADQLLDKIVSTTKAAGATHTGMLDSLLNTLRKQGAEVPNSVRTALYEAKTKDEVQYIFSKWMVEDQIPELLLPGGTQFGRLSAVTGNRLPATFMDDKSWFARRFAKSVSGNGINVVENPSGFYNLVLDALPHYNLSRGAVIPRFDVTTGERLAGTINIEDILDRIRLLPPNQKTEAYNLMGDLNEALFSSLVSSGKHGVDPRLAAHASRWFKRNGNDALFDAERFGKAHLDSGAYDTTVINDALQGGLGPQVSADLWTGALTIPDLRTLKRASNESDLIGRIANELTSKRKTIKGGTDLSIGEDALADRTWFLFASGIMNKVWKPFVLLRGAWTLRILMDDQARMLADGYSMFNHPMRVFNYALAMGEDFKTAFRKGYVDINGVRFSTKNLDEMQHASIFQEAMMAKRDQRVGRGAYGYRQHTPIPKGHPRYSEGMVFEVQHLNGSITTKVLAGSEYESAVSDTVWWLSGRGRKGLPDPSTELANLAELYRDTPEVAMKILQGDEATLTDVVGRQWAILNHRLGGDVVLDTGNGQLLDFSKYAKVDDVAPTGEPAKWVVRQRGDEDLMKIVASDNPRELSDAGKIDFQKLLDQKVSESPRFPTHVRGPMPVSESGAKEGMGAMLGHASDGAMDVFMTFPSNKLSRSPEFARAYWERMEQFLPYMDEGLKRKVLAQAPIKDRKALEKAAKRTTKGDAYITNMDQIDMQAKAYALSRVEQTLFNLMGNKRNISDSLNLVFPFVEAWGEFISRWGRLMVSGDMNIHTARRFQQAVEGARGSGFFHENEYGQEVFSYPAFVTQAGVKLHNTMNNIPGLGSVLGADVSPEVAQNINMGGSVSSLNFASGVIPGFGPVFQMGAKQFLPDDPKYDWLRDIIAPYGTSGGLLSSMAPAWLKRVMSANGGFDDPALTYTYNATRMDVIRTMIDRGDFAGVTSQADIQDLLDKADAETQGLLMVRAAATYFVPASPSMAFQKEDKTGMVWSYSNLGSEFYKIQQEMDGDEGAAFDEFYRRFGFLPQAFRGGKTYSVLDRSLTESGNQFERSNSALFNKYPATAMYVDPNIAAESEYNHEAMLAQLQQGLRENWTPQQFLYKQQDQLGDLWWDHANEVAAGMTSNQKEAYLIGVRAEIQDRYPYWNQEIPGKAQGATDEQQRAEVQQMINDPGLQNSPAVMAAAEYEDARQQVLDQLALYGSSAIDGPKSTNTDAGKVATAGRRWLRAVSEELIKKYPQFGELYRNVYSYEVAEVQDEIIPTIDVFGEGDYFAEMGLNEDEFVRNIGVGV